MSRPRTLDQSTSFVLKHPEYMHFRMIMERTPFSKSQLANLKGKFTETAFHEVVNTVEWSLQYKEYSLAAFLDIKAAFNNVGSKAIKKALTRLEF